MQAFHITNDATYYYRGSSSRPPCDEDHNYFVQKTPMKITKRNADKFKANIHKG